MGFNPDAFPDVAFDPVGFDKDGEATPAYPSVSSSRSIRLPSGGVWVVDPDVTDWCEIIWDVPDGLTLQSVTYVLPAALTNEDEAIDLVNGKSAVKVSGATHGSMSQIAAVATLSNGSMASCTAPLRCFNG